MRRLLCLLLLASCLVGGAEAAAFVNAAEWALPELTEAHELGLMPDGAADWDMGGQITRAEFAAVTVKLYEAMSQSAAPAGDTAAFRDTAEPAVFQAVALGFTNGVGEGRFAPDEAVSRQDAATMLARVYKKLYFPGWTLETDGAFLLPLNGILFFNDYERIDDWARDAVYFLSKYQVIRGDTAGNFNPHNHDGAFSDDTGTAARQEAILMALRMVRHLSEPVS